MEKSKLYDLEAGLVELVSECRICQDDDFIAKMESPCSCSGTLKVYILLLHIYICICIYHTHMYTYIIYMHNCCLLNFDESLRLLSLLIGIVFRNGATKK